MTMVLDRSPIRHHLKKPRLQKGAKERRTYKGQVYDSIKEAKRAATLDELRAAGEVLVVIEQVRFRLPGSTAYYLDFLVLWADGRITAEDVKGHRTEVYKIKKRQVEEVYAPLTITEV